MVEKLNYKIDVKNLNIHVEDSYLIKERADIHEALATIMSDPDYLKLKEAGFNRSEQSMYEEWAAHNTLYRWGYKRERTASVDIDQGESFLRLLAYAILALL